VTDKLSDGREIEQWEWERLRQSATLGVAGAGAAYGGAALYGEAQTAASVGGWATPSVSAFVPEVSLANAAIGYGLYSNIASGNYRGAAAAIGIPQEALPFIPNNSQPSAPTYSPPSSGGYSTTTPWLGAGSEYTPPAAADNTKRNLMIVGALVLTIGAAAYMARKK
jgi:hypothetical protein